VYTADVAAFATVVVVCEEVHALHAAEMTARDTWIVVFSTACRSEYDYHQNAAID